MTKMRKQEEAGVYIFAEKAGSLAGVWQVVLRTLIRFPMNLTSTTVFVGSLTPTCLRAALKSSR